MHTKNKPGLTNILPAEAKGVGLSILILGYL